jgi:phenylacetic acid degradation operon negative regulatory protein
MATRSSSALRETGAQADVEVLRPTLLRGPASYKPRGMVFDLFGDLVRPRTDGLPLSAIIEFLGFFDTAPSTVRVVMARLRRDGWMDSKRVGRETTYFLNDRSRQLLDEGRSRILERRIGAWDGNWYLLFYSVPEKERHLRDALRKQLAWLGYGPLALGTWISPHDHSQQARAQFDSNREIRFDTLTCQTGSLDRDRELVARCWDLKSLNRRYAAWIAKYQHLAEAPPGSITGAEALVKRMQVTHDYRQFPFADPMLPAELLPAQWKGEAAYELLMTIRERLDEQANRFFEQVVYGVDSEGPHHG